MWESVPFDPEVVREIMNQFMTDEEHINAQEPIEDAFDVQEEVFDEQEEVFDKQEEVFDEQEEVFDEQEDRACGCCGPLLQASLVGAGGFKEQESIIKWRDAWQVINDLHDRGASKYEPSFLLARGHKKGPIIFVLLNRKRMNHILNPKTRRALNKGKMIFMVSI